LEHEDYRAEHADDAAVRGILVGEAARAIEVAEQLVGAVDEVDDHARLPKRSTARARSASIARSRGSDVVTSESTSVRAIAATSSTARSKAASLTFEGFVKP